MGEPITKPMKFRKKPVVIEAMRYNGTNYEAIRDWANSYPSPDPNLFLRNVGLSADLKPQVYSLEGIMRLPEWHWVIKGVAGEFYVCDPDIFSQTYTAAHRE